MGNHPPWVGWQPLAPSHSLDCQLLCSQGCLLLDGLEIRDGFVIRLGLRESDDELRACLGGAGEQIFRQHRGKRRTARRFDRQAPPAREESFFPCWSVKAIGHDYLRG